MIMFSELLPKSVLDETREKELGARTHHQHSTSPNLISNTSLMIMFSKLLPKSVLEETTVLHMIIFYLTSKM
jgi:hypothetical protein